MYAVSEQYKAAMKQPVQSFRMKGTIGAVPFWDENILSGSFSITNQCSDETNVGIGQVYIGQLKATFNGLHLEKRTLLGKPITPVCGLKLADGSYEDVPLGVFYIAEANWTLSGVEITAYDGMSLFDKTVSLSSSQGSIYDFLHLACNACGVLMAQSKTDLQLFPNGKENLAVYEDNDIETWRDLVSWTAQAAGSFATMDREGKLILRRYTKEPVDTIDSRHRYTGAKFSDFETRYTGVSRVDIATQTTKYYCLDADDGLTYNLGANPLLQYGVSDTLEQQTRAVLSALSAIDYVPMEVSMIGNPAYDLGDVLVFSDGIADGDKLYCITKYDWTYGGEYKVKGVGQNPALASARSKVDKNLAGLMNRVDGDAVHYYDYQNAQDIHIGDGQSGKIIEFHYVTTKDTHVDFHAEIIYQLNTTESILEGTFSEQEGILKVSYELNGESITDYYPMETASDGTHLLHLLYTWNSTANIIGSFLVNITMEGGEIDIGMAQARAYISGQGLVGDGAWDGTTQVEDTLPATDLREVLLGDFEDSVSSVFVAAKDFALNDQISHLDVAEVLLRAFSDAIGPIFRLHQFTVSYAKDVMAYDRVTYDGAVWKNADGASQGTLTTPVCEVSAIMQITSKHSGDDVAYLVSFDKGKSWWTYADEWVTPDYTQDVYGMFEGTMRSITPSAWAEKCTGSVMVRAILTESATVTDIQIYEEEISA